MVAAMVAAAWEAPRQASEEMFCRLSRASPLRERRFGAPGFCSSAI